MTNFERIKAMTIEEIDRAIGGRDLCSYIQDEFPSWCESRDACTNCVKEWLESEVQDEEEN